MLSAQGKYAGARRAVPLLDIYNKLYRHFGPRRWWPADTDFEIIIGAILTQNTSWSNVEKAITNLKRAGLLTPRKLQSVSVRTLARLIKPSGYYNIKVKRLKSFLDFLFKEYNGSLKRMFSCDWRVLREKLLSVNGIGPETADSILLYAGNKPVFVIDAYTKRIFSRHNFVDSGVKYEQLQKIFMENLPHQAGLFNEYHALIVELGKNICRTKPRCQICPIR